MTTVHSNLQVSKVHLGSRMCRNTSSSSCIYSKLLPVIKTTDKLKEYETARLSFNFLISSLYFSVLFTFKDCAENDSSETLRIPPITRLVQFLLPLSHLSPHPPACQPEQASQDLMLLLKCDLSICREDTFREYKVFRDPSQGFPFGDVC